MTELLENTGCKMNIQNQLYFYILAMNMCIYCVKNTVKFIICEQNEILWYKSFKTCTGLIC